jgi:hypothetical protein
VSQPTIVTRKYHVAGCWTSQTAAQIAQFMNTSWVDESTQASFNSTLTGVFDAAAGVAQMNNNVIINELINQRPLIYCNITHCMVVVGIKYTPTPGGPNVREVDVMDPWPPNPRFRTLSAAEMMPAGYYMGQPVGSGQASFVASAYVSP